MNLFTDLSYNNKTLQPIGRPVDDLGALYLKKEKDYNYVDDLLNTTETALGKIPYHEKDKTIIDNAKKIFSDNMSVLRDSGDLENKILDTKKLANDLSSKYGLADVQRVATEKASYINGLKERLNKPAEEGGISQSDYMRAVLDAENNYKGLQFDESSDTYIGQYNGRAVLPKFNFSEKVAGILKGFKADEIPLRDANGNLIIKNPSGKGYLIHGTKEKVTEADLTEAARNYLQNDPDFKDRVNDDLYYELKSLTTDSEGNKKELNIDDIKNTLGAGTTKALATSLGLKNTNNIQKALEEKGLTLEEAYIKIRKEQMAVTAIGLGVEKESFNKFKTSYLKDWMLEEAMKGQSNSIDTSNFGILHSFYTNQRSSSEDLSKISDAYNTTLETINQNKEELYDMQKKKAHPNDIKRKNEEIAKRQKKVAIIESRMNKVLEKNPDLIKEIKKLVKGETTPDLSFTSLMNPGINKIPGLSINSGAAQRLIFKAIKGNITDEEVEAYININEEELIKKDLKNVPFDALIETPDMSKVFVDEFNKGKNLSNIYRDKGINKIKEIVKPSFIEEVEEKAKKTKENSVALLRKKIVHLANQFKDKAEQGTLKYTEEFKFPVIPDLSPGDKRANSLHQLKFMANGMTTDTNYFMGLSSTLDGLDVKTSIEERWDVEDEEGEILWEEGSLQPSLDTMQESLDPMGGYKPVLLFNVPIMEGKKKRKIQIPVNSNNNSYNAKYLEAVKDYKKKLMAKANTTSLEPTEREWMDRVNINMYNSTVYGSNFDLLNLHNVQDKETIKYQFWDKDKVNPAYIKIFETASPQDFSYYLMDGDDENSKYYVKNNVTGKTITVEELDLEAKDEFGNYMFTALGASTPNDLKKLLSSLVFDSSLGNNKPQETFRVSNEETVDITSIFNTNIKKGVNPRVHKDVVPNLKALNILYPGLIITDALRAEETTVGVEDSKHKIGKGLDLRLNEDAYQLIKLSPTQLNGLGIKSAKIHNNNHVHVEFL